MRWDGSGDKDMDYKQWQQEVDYIKKTGTPEQKELCDNWGAGIGLQKVDNLSVSSYLLELSLRNIKGEIDFDEIEELLQEYHGKKVSQ